MQNSAKYNEVSPAFSFCAGRISRAPRDFMTMTTLIPRLSFVLAALVPLAILAVSLPAQEKQPQRVLAQGILTVIPPAPEEQETWHGPLPLVEVPANISDLEYAPNFEPKTA